MAPFSGHGIYIVRLIVVDRTLQQHPDAASGGRDAAVQATVRRFPMSIGLLSDLAQLDARIAELLATGRFNVQHSVVTLIFAFMLR